MNTVKLAAFGLLLSAAVPAWAAPNLLTNGSFESYNSTTATFTGWTNAGNTGVSPSRYAVQQPTNGSSAGSAYGDAVSPDPYRVSSDSAGGFAAFFDADQANYTLSQTIALQVGRLYEVGFDLFKTASGAGNAGPFTITGEIGSNVVVTATSSSLGTATWTHYAATFVATTTSAVFALHYVSGTAPAADVLADLAYVAAVPEPATMALLGLGLGGAFLVRRRRAA